ncbi:cytochrome P450 [Phycomyces blakesleeanus]|uniref:Cytochrome P450 n=1 Tax=Phycomyces blakesleeanus TaxID=4837 RepID=A0ABR3B466_PHYBL
MGIQTWIMVSDPYIAHELFSTRGSLASSRPAHGYLRDICSAGGCGLIFAETSKKWHRTRSAAMALLSPKSVDPIGQDMIEEADKLTKALIEGTAKHGCMSPSEDLYLVSYNVIMTVCFGLRAESVEDPDFKAMIDYIHQHGMYSGLSGDVGSFLPILSLAAYISGIKKKQIDFVKVTRDQMFSRLMEKGINGEKDCFAKSLYEGKDKYGLDHQDILVLLGDIIFAGTDTTALTTTWLLAILSNYPDVQRKIQAEIDDFVAKNGRLPLYSDRESFPYLAATQKEGLRLRSITEFGVPHEASEDINLRGYHVPKNAILIGSLDAMHTDPLRYANPEKFIPERFLGYPESMSTLASGSIKKRDQYNFGWGRRLCPGIYMAETEMFYNLTRIFHRCNMEPPLDVDGNPIIVNIDKFVDHGITSSPVPYKMRFIPRSEALF